MLAHAGALEEGNDEIVAGLGHNHPARLVPGLQGPPLRFEHVGETLASNLDGFVDQVALLALKVGDELGDILLDLRHACALALRAAAGIHISTLVKDEGFGGPALEEGRDTTPITGLGCLLGGLGLKGTVQRCDATPKLIFGCFTGHLDLK